MFVHESQVSISALTAAFLVFDWGRMEEMPCQANLAPCRGRPGTQHRNMHCYHDWGVSLGEFCSIIFATSVFVV